MKTPAFWLIAASALIVATAGFTPDGTEEPFEVAGVINRLRSLVVEPISVFPEGTAKSVGLQAAVTS